MGGSRWGWVLRIKFHGTRHGDIDVDTYRGVRRERQRDSETERLRENIVWFTREKGGFLLKIPRGDIDGVGEVK